MSGDWIKMKAELFTHPKVIRISSSLKADNLRTVGGLMSVWCIFDAHSVDGILGGYTLETLDDHLRWPSFCAAMISVKWLQIIQDENGESLAVPEFEKHNGQSAKRRAQEANRKRDVRKTSVSDGDKTISSDSFSMFLGWQPSDHLPDMVRQAGAQITPAITQEVIAYWLGQPKTKRTQAEWDKALLNSALHVKTKTAARSTKKLTDENFAERNYGKEVTTL